MLRLYKSMVRPHVEYCTVAWSPHYIKDKQLIEKIQRRFIKMIPGFRDKSYEEGLRILSLNTLEKKTKPSGSNLSLQMYKGLSRPSFKFLFQLTKHDRTRDHTLKLIKHCTSKSGFTSFPKEWSITWTNPSLRLAVWIHSNGVYIITKITRWTYLWINIRMVLGRIRCRVLVRLYQVNNHVNTIHKRKLCTTYMVLMVVCYQNVGLRIFHDSGNDNKTDFAGSYFYWYLHVCR